MYWCYRLKSYQSANQDIQAKLIEPKPHLKIRKGESGFGFPSILQTESYGINMEFVYQVNSKHWHPDNYDETHSFRLFSERLVELMDQFEVQFEIFPVTMIDEKENILSELKYFVFHSLEDSLDAMDAEGSEWQGDKRIGVPKLALRYDKFEHRPMFRCKYINVPLMRNDLKEAIQRLEITGFGFLAPEKYTTRREGGYKSARILVYDD